MAHDHGVCCQVTSNINKFLQGYPLNLHEGNTYHDFRMFRSVHVPNMSRSLSTNPGGMHVLRIFAAIYAALPSSLNLSALHSLLQL